MIQRLVYGPVAYLAPDSKLDASLEIAGVKEPPAGCTVHVFLDEVSGDDLDTLVQTANYAGFFTLPSDVSEQGSVRISVTSALKKAAKIRPNFHITFLVEYTAGEQDSPLLQFDALHILHTVPHNTKLNISADVLGGLVPGADGSDDKCT